MRQTNWGLVSIQERYFSLLRETPNQKDNKSKIPTTDFLVTARQKDNLSNNTIIKNTQEYTAVYGILFHRDHLFMTNHRQPFIINLLSILCLNLWTNRLPRYLGVSVLKTPNIFHNLIKFCLHVMKGTLRITLMLFDSCLSLIETVGF